MVNPHQVIMPDEDGTLENGSTHPIPYFTPAQDPPAGTPVDPSKAPSLFAPIKMRGLTFQNRIMVSPMCQYSADNGYATSWHRQHLGSFNARGPSLVITEVLAITPQGRISPEDGGIWDDGHVAPLKEIVDFAHSQNSKIAVQIGHAGRKASTLAPWKARRDFATKEENGWPDEVIGPSSEPYSDKLAKPKQMTLEDIEQFKRDWTAAVKRCLAAGFDAIEIHAAHGYMLSSFLSPASNHRTDAYGGSFENRVRLLLEVVTLTRSLIPSTQPLLVRLNGTDYLHYDTSLPQWHFEEAGRLGRLLAENGVDLLDVSGGGNDARQKITPGPGYQVEWAREIKKAVEGTGVLVSAVGSITSGKQAQGYLDAGDVDIVMSGREFLKNPNLVWTWAEELDVQIYVAAQYGWPLGVNRRSKI